MVIDDISVQIVKSLLPGFVLCGQWIASVLHHGPQHEFRVLYFFYNTIIKQQMSLLALAI